MQKLTLTPQSVAEALRGQPALQRREAMIQLVMLTCAIFCIFVTVGIVFILLEVGIQFFTDEYFANSGLLEQAARELAIQQGVPARELADITRLAVDERAVTFTRIAERIPNTTPEALQEYYENLKQTTSGGQKLWLAFTNSLRRFFLDNRWTPLFASKRFGIWPLVNGTVLVSAVAMMVAVPFGLLTAIYLSLYAGRQFSTLMRPIVEILAGIPTVVYGYFALLYISPIVQRIYPDAPIFNVLSAGLMMGVMIIPTVSSISIDAINAVPRSLLDGAYALGATKMEVILRVVFPAAISGIIASIILGISRAVGETMIVTVAAGQQPVAYGDSFWSALQAAINPLQSMATMTAFIAQVALGDAPAGSIEYKTLYAVGLSLFLMTLAMNLLSQYISKRFREVYE
ncbi:MAG: phosphate ABC transporter permease subunit PstC [Thermostichales cyanobacterium BF4_bins_65]